MLIALLLQAATPAICPAPQVPAPGTWFRPDAVAPVSAGVPTVQIGPAWQSRLQPGETIRPAVPPERAAPAGSHAGLFAFVVPAAGRYRISLNTATWIEVIADGKAVASATHGHGQPCSGVRKMVDFDLKPGHHLLQLSGSKEPNIRFMVTRLPR